MLALLLMTAMAVQQPTTAAPKPPAANSRATAPVSRVAFQNTMRELWNDHVVYTHQFIVTATAGTADTAAVLERLLRNQDEIGDAVKPYYGDAAGAQLATLLRSHIQLAGRALNAARAGHHAMMMTTTASMTLQNDTTKVRSTDSTQQMKSGRITDTTRVPATVRVGVDTMKSRTNAQDPMTTARVGDTTKVGAQSQMADSQTLTAAIAALRANGDSIATFLSGANARHWSKATLQGAFQMHINLLLQEATARVKGDWQGSIAAFDARRDQAMQMADILSEGIIKQFPTRFTNKPTTMSSR